MKTLEAFCLKCLQQILEVRYHQQISNSEILSHAGIGPLAEQIERRRKATFGHIARLADNIPARLALHCQINASLRRLRYGAMVLERRYGPRRPRGPDDDFQR